MGTKNTAQKVTSSFLNAAATSSVQNDVNSPSVSSDWTTVSSSSTLTVSATATYNEDNTTVPGATGTDPIPYLIPISITDIDTALSIVTNSIENYSYGLLNASTQIAQTAYAI